MPRLGSLTTHSLVDEHNEGESLNIKTWLQFETAPTAVGSYSSLTLIECAGVLALL